MINFYDIAYTFGLGAAAPVWAVRSKTRKKVLDAFVKRMGQIEGPAKAGGHCVMLHAVSVGELNAAAGLIKALRERYPGVHLVISTTTDTGAERANALYGNDHDVTLIRYPLDFSLAVGRVLDGLKPQLVILMELELWPNFMAACWRRNIPVMVANGRITESSFRNFRIGSWLTRRMFRRLSAVAAQERAYADRFITLGAPPEKVTVTGTMKFDTAPAGDTIPGAAELAEEMGLRDPLWIAGSTGPGEEQIVLDAYKTLLTDFPDLQLAVIPRKPERFDEVATLIQQSGYSCIRRSKITTSDTVDRGTGFQPVSSSTPENHGLETRATATQNPYITPPSPKSQAPDPIILGDTMGELRKFYAAATVVFVGRTLVDLGEKQHGSDMIEPAALGKPTIVGPFTGNFTEVMNAFRAAEAMVEIENPAQLAETVARLLRDPGEIGARARATVTQQRGATERTMGMIATLLPIEASKENAREGSAGV